MSYEISLKKSVEKELKKIEKSNSKIADKIIFFIRQILAKSDNPCLLENAKHLVGYSDNRYRWRLGAYRIIGIVKNNEFKIIQIIKIDKKDNRTYKGL